MQPQFKASYYTLGCKLNFAETSTIARQLTEAGFAKVEFEAHPDLYVINTCSVTDHADKKCRNIVKRALRVNPNAFIVVIGCYAQLKPEEIAAIPGVDLVLGAQEKFNIEAYLENLTKNENTLISSTEIKEVRQFVPSYSVADRTRTFLKVQDGCDYFCAFCTIPLARGFSRSGNIEETLNAAREAAKSGVKEIVLTGVNIGDFGSGTEENFLQLIQQLDEIDGVERFRISSIEPNLLNDQIIEFVASSKKFLPHFHIPLQSGSDRILKLMRRRYLKELYADRVAKIKKLMPHACIGVDVIVGFPSESESDFMETYEFLNELDASYFHVFTYSERENTTAIRIPEIVSHEERNKRNKMLTILSAKKRRAFNDSQKSKSFGVLVESEEEGGYLFGFTENYIKVKLPFESSLINQIVQVKLIRPDGDGVYEIEMNPELIQH